MRREEIKLLKILRVTNDLYPEVVGGIPLHTHHLCRDLSRMGYYTTVLTCSRGDHGHAKIDGYNVIYHKILFSPLGNSFSPHIFRTLLKIRHDYDLIHAHCHLFLSTIMASLVRRIGSPPLIITTHGIMSASAPDWFNVLYMKTIGKWTLKSADRVICYTEMEKDKLANMLKIDSEKISVIPNGVDTDVFRPDPNNNKRSNQSNNAITILWVGRFVRGKGVEFIIHAAKILVKEVPDLKILLVGDGPSKGKIKGLIEKFNLKKNVIIKENVPNENMPEVYQKSDIFVLPSLNEGVPKTLLEAMACGIPVVITEFSHLKELIKNAGLTFPKGDVHALADKIMRLIRDRELAKELGNNGRNKIVEGHSWKNTVLKTIELYEEVARRK